MTPPTQWNRRRDREESLPDGAIGIDHPTVVPTNFDPDDDSRPRYRG